MAWKQQLPGQLSNGWSRLFSTPFLPAGFRLTAHLSFGKTRQTVQDILLGTDYCQNLIWLTSSGIPHTNHTIHPPRFVCQVPC